MLSRFHISVALCWVSILAAAVFLRFEDLASRPIHADEATGARIAAQRMESGGTGFDPTHYHGPTQSRFAMTICHWRCENSWREMSKGTLRILPAIAGSLLVLLPFFWRKRIGDASALLAAALLAGSPLLVYYSRMFIHEMLLTLFGLAAMLALAYRAPALITGTCIGLMFATKETFIISLIAWSAAGGLLLFEKGRPQWASIRALWNQHRISIALAASSALLTAAFFYTDAFREARGMFDAIRTFFVYETAGGHDKPIGYYAKLFALPVKSGGTWWFGTPVILLAATACIHAFGKTPPPQARVIRFIAISVILHALAYSVIRYKNPWLACLPWAQLCLLAGYSLAGFSNRSKSTKAWIVAIAAIAIVTQTVQSRHATGRLASDERNPFAYVPTRQDIEDLEPWLKKLQAIAPGQSIEPIAVIGNGYWPLPWVLRSFENTGYWQNPPPNLAAMPIVLAMPEHAASVAKELEATHQPLPRGLRSGVPVMLFVKRDLWQLWMQHDPR
jgi:uncharacterized protein (TIGR03663 family)